MSAAAAENASAVPPSPPAASCCGGFRWRGLLLILLIGPGIFAAASAFKDSMALGIEGVVQLAAILGTILALAIFTFRNGLKGSAYWKFVGIMAVLGGLTAAAVRFEKFDGDMRPIFSMRLTPTLQYNPTLAERSAAQIDANRAARAAKAKAASEKPAGTAAPAGTAVAEASPPPAPATPAGSESSPPPALPPLTAEEAAAQAAIGLSWQPAPTDFPGFLGGDRLGVVRSVKLDPDWNANPPKELWRQSVGLGWSGFSVVGKLAVTQEQRRGDEAVVAYDLETGAEAWEHLDRGVNFQEAMGGNGPRATPTIYRGRVYALGATGVLNCLELSSGRLIWRKEILPDPNTQNLTWAMSGSPLATGDLVVVGPGVKPGRSLVAFHWTDGHEVWASGDDAAAYGSPQLCSLYGVPQILILNGERLVGHDPASGKQLWNFPWVTAGTQRINTTQPMVLAEYGVNEPEGAVFIASGYAHGCALLQVKKEGDSWSCAKEPLWQNLNLKAKFSNMVIREGCVFGLDEGIMVCVDLKTGKQKWKGGRYGHGQILLVDDLIVVQSEAGKVYLVAADPDKRKELGSIDALPDRTWNTLTLSGDLLLVRNDSQAICYRLKTK